MRYYVDTSVALHALLPGGDVRAIAWFESVDEADELFSSALIELEIARVLRRESLDLTDGRAVLDRLKAEIPPDANAGKESEPDAEDEEDE